MGQDGLLVGCPLGWDREGRAHIWEYMSHSVWGHFQYFVIFLSTMGPCRVPTYLPRARSCLPQPCTVLLEGNVENSLKY